MTDLPQVIETIDRRIDRAIVPLVKRIEALEGGAPQSPVMCIGWPTIKRLAAGESVWFESLGCGAVAADDLHGADIDAAAAHSRPDAMEPK
jgi:hypothetical protein